MDLIAAWNTRLVQMRWAWFYVEGIFQGQEDVPLEETQPWGTKSNLVELPSEFFHLPDDERAPMWAPCHAQHGANIRKEIPQYAYHEAG